MKLHEILRLIREKFVYLFVPNKDPKHIYSFLGIITLAALILRLYIINRPVGYDEAYTFIHFSSKPFKFILADYHAPNNHILNSLLVGIAYRILGGHTWIVRIPAFFASLMSVPMAYFAGRRLFNPYLALAASAAVAIAPNLIIESANGRGYPLIILFSLLLVNFAGILVKEQNRTVLVAYAITGALGFYTIPIFLYPMAGISLWVATTHLFSNVPWRERLKRFGTFLIACIASGALTFILYSPVIFFGTGFKSLVANEIVKSQTWNDFLENLVTRSSLTWRSWTEGANPFIKNMLTAGLLISLIFYRKVSNQKLPMQVMLVLGAGVMLLLQRVAPLPRIWSHLEMFYLFFSATGLAWLMLWTAWVITDEQTAGRLVAIGILLTVIISFTYTTVTTQNRAARADRTIAPELFAAEYLAEHITINDTIVAVAPADIQTAYYLKVIGVSFDFFFQRDHPVDIQNALVLVRTRGEYGFDTLQKVLDFYQLTPTLDTDAGELVFEYGPLLIYSVPAR